MPPYPKSLQCPPKKARKKWRPGPRKATGELAIFEYVWLTRPHNCEICGHGIKVARTCCFAHRFGKGTHGAERLDPANIALVCSETCHQKVDALRKTTRWPDIVKKTCNPRK